MRVLRRHHQPGTAQRDEVLERGVESFADVACQSGGGVRLTVGKELEKSPTRGIAERGIDGIRRDHLRWRRGQGGRRGWLAHAIILTKPEPFDKPQDSAIKVREAPDKPEDSAIEARETPNTREDSVIGVQETANPTEDSAIEVAETPSMPEDSAIGAWETADTPQDSAIVMR